MAAFLNLKTVQYLKSLEITIGVLELAFLGFGVRIDYFPINLNGILKMKFFRKLITLSLIISLGTFPVHSARYVYDYENEWPNLDDYRVVAAVVGYGHEESCFIDTIERQDLVPPFLEAASEDFFSSHKRLRFSKEEKCHKREEMALQIASKSFVRDSRVAGLVTGSILALACISVGAFGATIAGAHPAIPTSISVINAGGGYLLLTKGAPAAGTLGFASSLSIVSGLTIFCGTVGYILFKKDGLYEKSIPNTVF